jgi:transposase
MGVWSFVSSFACGPPAEGIALDAAHRPGVLREQPIQRAIQRDEAEIRRWRTHTWFEIQKRGALEHRILLSADESGFYLLPALVCTYAPIGQTPVRKALETRDHLSMMSAISTQGWLFTRSSYTALTGLDSVRFLSHLRTQIDRKLLVIWDGSPIHRNADVREYLANGAAKQIHLERLPPYAPDLNPDEGTWSQLKYVELANVCCADLLDLHPQLDSAVSRLRHKPQSFVPSLRKRDCPSEKFTYLCDNQ